MQNTVFRTSARRWADPVEWAAGDVLPGRPIITVHTGDALVTDRRYTTFWRMGRIGMLTSRRVVRANAVGKRADA